MKMIKKHKYIILIFFITTALLLELFTTPRNFGHDTIFHTPNIIQLSKTISLTNIFGSKLITYDSNIFGYGTWLFYPKLPHLLASYLYLIFKNVYTSMNIIYFITTFLSGVFMFLLSKKIFNNRKIALISSIIYLTIPYHLCEIYVRDAFAENFMFMVTPLIFLGLYYLKDNNYNQFYITFIPGYIIGMYSHLISMVFCTISVAIFILYYHKSFFRKEKVKALIISTILVTGLSLPFLITIIEYKAIDTYTVFLSDNFTNRTSVVERVVHLKEYYNQTPQSDRLQVYFNYTTIILFIITTIQVIFKKTKERKKIIPLLLFIVLLVNLISSKIIWKNIPEFFLTIQFPWRLLVLLSMFVALYAPICLLAKIEINKKFKNIILCLIIILISIEGLGNIIYYGNFVLTESYVLNNSAAMGHQREYLPLKTNKCVADKYLSYWNKAYTELREDGIISDNINTSINIIENEFPSLVFEVDNLKGKTTIELPRVYYLGYELKDKKGNKIKLTNNTCGFLEVEITKEGKYTLTHDTTIPEKIANIIGIFTLVLCIGFAVKRYKNEK